MNPALRKAGTAFVKGFYKVFMKRTSVYATFVVVGAYFGEKAVDKGVQAIWDYNNTGRKFEDISVFKTMEEAE